MTMLLSVIIAVVILVATISIGYYAHSGISPTPAPIQQTLNQKISDSIKGYEEAYAQQAEYTNASTNITNIFNNLTNSIHSLENYTSFKEYYANYPSAFSFGTVWDDNYSDFNSLDPLGLNLDYFYFQFLGIYNSANSNLIKPGYDGTITYSINVGNGAISGPNLTINRIMYG